MHSTEKDPLSTKSPLNSLRWCQGNYPLWLSIRTSTKQTCMFCNVEHTFPIWSKHSEPPPLSQPRPPLPTASRIKITGKATGKQQWIFQLLYSLMLAVRQEQYPTSQRWCEKLQIHEKLITVLQATTINVGPHSIKLSLFASYQNCCFIHIQQLTKLLLTP